MERNISVFTNMWIIASLGIALMEFIPIIGGGKTVFLMSGEFSTSGSTIIEILTTRIFENIGLIIAISTIWAVNGCAAGVRSKKLRPALISCLLGFSLYLIIIILLNSLGALMEGLFLSAGNPEQFLLSIQIASSALGKNASVILGSLIGFGTALQFALISGFIFALATAKFMTPEKEEKIGFRDRGKIWRDEEMWVCKKCQELIPPGVLQCYNCGERVLD
ncbi:MAG: hypothetical protein ACFFC7_17920 [Candidatus Hermodarchaeota archaeon]